jgi:hypothetical protein
MPNEKSPLWYALQSRKFWAAIVGLVLMIVASVVNKDRLDPDTLVNGIMVIISAYMGAVALEDGMTQRDSGRTKVDTPANTDVTVTTTPSDAPRPTVGMTGLQ